MKFSYIIALAVFTLSVHAETMQKRQYRKRHHKVQINSSSLQFGKKFDVEGSVDVGYSYNFGHIEAGLVFGMKPDFNLIKIASELDDLNLLVGLNVEANFIRNKRRNNFIPAVGVKAYALYDGDVNFIVAPFVSSKHFISSRTSINLELGVPLNMLEVLNPSKLYDSMQFSMGYAYYFH